MPLKIKLKRFTASSGDPSTSDLEVGEVGINPVQKKWEPRDAEGKGIYNVDFFSLDLSKENWMILTRANKMMERLRLEFDKFRKLVNLQMASIGGGGETRLLKLDDVDTSSLGNGKFLVFNSTTNKLEFTDQIDGN